MSAQGSFVTELSSLDPADVLDGVPPILHHAVSGVCERFKDFLVRWALVTREICFAQIHDDWKQGRQESFDYIISAIGDPRLTRELHDALRQRTLPGILKAMFSLYLDELDRPAECAFDTLRLVAIQHRGKLTMGPVEWAQERANLMIRSRRINAEEWIRDACGDWAEWERWRAPRLLAMAFGTAPFEAERAWELLDPKSSRALVEGFADRYVSHLFEVVDVVAREAQIERAMLPASPVASATRTRPANRKPITAAERRRREVIREVAEAQLEGPHYCAELDRKGVKPNLAWEVISYAEGYRNAKVRKHIQDEKYSVTKRARR